MVFLLLLFSVSQILAQESIEDQSQTNSIKNKEFDHVYLITEEDIKYNEKECQLNVHIPNTNKKPTIFVRGRVPLHLLASVYPEFSKIIVITPNWAYYDEVSILESSEDAVGEEPIASSVVYEFDRTHKKIEKDSIVIYGGFPKMNYAELKEE